MVFQSTLELKEHLENKRKLNLKCHYSGLIYMPLAIMSGVILIQSGQSPNKKLSQIEMRMVDVQVLCTSKTSLQVCCFLGECAKFTYPTQNLWNKVSKIMNVSSYYGSSHTTTATSLFKLYCTVMCVWYYSKCFKHLS